MDQLLDIANPLFSIVAEGIQTGVLVVDREMKIIYWNRWFSQYTGLNLIDHHKCTLSDVFPLIKVHDREVIYRQVMETKQARFLSPRFHPAVFVENEDVPRFHYLRLLPIIVEGMDETQGVITIIEDLTNSIEFERGLRQSEVLFRTTLFSIGDAVMVIDMNGQVQHMNMAAERLTGWTEQDAKGQLAVDVFKIINEESRKEVESPVVKVLREGVVVGLANHTLLIAKDGNELPIADSGAPIKNDRGEITGVVLVFRDQTDERAAQKALEELNADLDERVRERTDKLSFLVNSMAGREVRMAELKKVIIRLRKQLQDAGMKPVANDPLID